MKLQVNNSGAWKHVITFAVADVELVKNCAEVLGEASAGVDLSVSFRILDGQEQAVLMWTCTGGWTVPRWAEGYTWVP